MEFYLDVNRTRVVTFPIRAWSILWWSIAVLFAATGHGYGVYAAMLVSMLQFGE